MVKKMCDKYTRGNRSITLDLRVGGLGDNWMRLVGFYVAAALHPDCVIQLILPEKLRRVAQHTFGDRLEILSELGTEKVIVYAVLGIRDLLPDAVRGRHFASPYGRVVINDWNRWTLKDRLNSVALSFCDKIGWVYSPPWESLAHYQGYSEVVTLPVFRKLTIEQFEEQLLKDSSVIKEKLQTAPVSAEFILPEGLASRVVVFPSGTGYQFIPMKWALRHLPDAVYAFFHRDPELELWRAAGLMVVPFYTEPGDMLMLARSASAAASTDSFPSHFLQYGAPRFVAMLTELPRHRIISPAFSGAVIESVAPCHPCPHLERRGFPICKAGHSACLNWESEIYTRRIKDALNGVTSLHSGI